MKLKSPAPRIAGRIEADHFALLLPAEPLDISGWYQRLSTWLSRYSDRFHLSCSVGVYEIADPRLDVSLMCDRAMLALQATLFCLFVWSMFDVGRTLHDAFCIH